MRKILGAVATLSLLLACGCEGYNTYSFHGQLVMRDNTPVSPGMAVHVLPTFAGAIGPAAYDSEFGITDDEGKFRGTLISPALQVSPFAPDPPMVNRMTLTLTDATHTFTIPLDVNSAQQKTIKDGAREIDLGRITAPISPATQPAADTTP